MPSRNDARHRVAAALRAGRRAKSMTQEQLAARAGCSVETISNAERATSLPGLELFLELAAILGMDVGALVEPSKTARSKTKARLALEAEVQALARAIPDDWLELWLETGRLFERN